MTNINIMSVNCQGLCSPIKRNDVFNYLKSKQGHIYCLQDVHFTKNIENIIHTEWEHDCLFSFGKSNSRGVAILFSKDLDFVIHKYISDPEGNYIIVDITIDNNRLTLISIYAPNQDSPMFFNNIMSIADTIKNKDLIICGDYNLVQDPTLDYFNYKFVNNKKAREKVLEIKSTYNLIDPYREFYPTTKRFSWRKNRPLKMARLDFFLISENLLSSINSCNIEPGYRSDHSIIVLKCNFTQFVKGKPLWKLNNSLLSDINYLNIINDKINEIKTQYALPIYNIENINNISNTDLQFTINDQLFLDTLLMEIRGKTISYSCYKKKETDKQEREIIEKIDKLEQCLNSDNINTLNILNEELLTLRRKKMDGHFIRSRAQFIEEGEKPSKFFCNLEKNNFTSKIIPKLEMPDGSIISNQKEILKQTKYFYENLYTNKDEILKNVDLNIEFSNINIPKLTDIESKALEGLITYDEASSSLSNMKNNRSQGSDGFGADFFKVFWAKLGHFVVRSLNYGYIKGELSLLKSRV